MSVQSTLKKLSDNIKSKSNDSENENRSKMWVFDDLIIQFDTGYEHLFVVSATLALDLLDQLLPVLGLVCMFNLFHVNLRILQTPEKSREIFQQHNLRVITWTVHKKLLAALLLPGFSLSKCFPRHPSISISNTVLKVSVWRIGGKTQEWQHWFLSIVW